MRAKGGRAGASLQYFICTTLAALVHHYTLLPHRYRHKALEGTSSYHPRPTPIWIGVRARARARVGVRVAVGVRVWVWVWVRFGVEIRVGGRVW